MNEALTRYIEQATTIIERLQESKSHDLLHIVDVMRMGRGVITQQAKEIELLRNELEIKTNTITQILRHRPITLDFPKEPA